MSLPETSDSIAIILVAAGSSLRFGIDKQLAQLGGMPVFLHAVMTFLPEVDQMVIAIPPGRQEDYRQILQKFHCDSPKITLAEGGATRTQSVQNALAALAMPDGIVGIHDAARPLATAALFRRLVETARIHGGAAPGRPVTDTLLMADADNSMTGIQPRLGLWHIATPQVFNLRLLRDAYNAIGNATFTDDTQVFFNSGHAVKILPETGENLKITYPEDLLRAEMLLNQRKKLFLASPLGFCNGVRHALTLFNKIRDEHPGEPIYILNELVHNSVITRQMLQDGANFVQNMDEIPDGALTLLGAHGVTKDAEETARRRHLRIYDAICPHVARLQAVAAQAFPDVPLVFLGDKSHAEVISILDHAAARKIHLVEKPADIQKLPSMESALFLSQTTRNAAEIAETASWLRQRVRHLQEYAQACDAVTRRQTAMARLAHDCDAAIVVGSSHSANARQLFKLADAQCAKTIFAETAEDIREDDLHDARTIALGTATSTPDGITQAIVEKLNLLGYVTQPSRP